MHAVLRRTAAPEASTARAQAPPIRFGRCSLDVTARTLLRDGEVVGASHGGGVRGALRAREPRRARRCRANDLRASRAGVASGLNDRSIDMQIARLRKLVEAEPARPRYLRTVWVPVIPSCRAAQPSPDEAAAVTRFADSMFARTALLVAASGLVFAILFLAVGRSFAGLPAIRASAGMLAEVLERDPRAVAQPSEGPPRREIGDQSLALTLIWRTSCRRARRRSSGRALEARDSRRRTARLFWARMPTQAAGLAGNTELPADGLRAGVPGDARSRCR